MKLASWKIALVAVALTVTAHAARNWQTGTLTETEQEKVKEGATHNTTTDGTVKAKGNNKADYSQNTTTTSTDNMETYQVYTIEAGDKIYVAREHLLFPWSKPANVTVGGKVKFVVEKGKMYLLDDDGKEHKASVSKTSMKPAS